MGAECGCWKAVYGVEGEITQKKIEGLSFDVDYKSALADLSLIDFSIQ